MRMVGLMLPLVLGTVGLVSCGGGGSIASSSYNPGYGPFDKNGNYVEEWADKPAKKHWWARKPDPVPDPTPAATPKKTEPLVAKNTSKPKPSGSSYRRVPGAVGSPMVNYSAPTSKPKPEPVASVSKTKPKPVASVSKPKPKPIASTSKPKPKPKPVVVKPKTPAPRRHLVKKGDTLYGLSRKYGTSVSAIQRANGLKGTTIRTGKTIVIPR